MTAHPSLFHLRSALDALHIARTDLRNGPHEYRAHRMAVDEMILTLTREIEEIVDTDYALSPEGRAEARAWDRQTRANWGPL